MFEPIYGIESMLEVELPGANEEEKRADFLKIVETLTRMGIVSRSDNGRKKLIQSAHLLHKQGKYYIVHFKEMFLLDGRKETEFSGEDKLRRDVIANRLEEWGLLKILDRNRLSNSDQDVYVKVIPHKEKHLWELETKYNIGRAKK